MKSLEEVIKIFTKSFDNTYNIVPLDCEPEYGEDALHYLKMLRDMTCGTSQILRNTSQITCPKCHSEFVILPDINTPLTWDELKTMEGKPVWIEADNGQEQFKHWFIIDEFTFTDIPGLQIMWCLNNSFRFWEADIGVTWQAYRKERS